LCDGVIVLGHYQVRRDLAKQETDLNIVSYYSLDRKAASAMIWHMQGDITPVGGFR